MKVLGPTLPRRMTDTRSTLDTTADTAAWEDSSRVANGVRLFTKRGRVSVENQCDGIGMGGVCARRACAARVLQ